MYRPAESIRNIDVECFGRKPILGQNTEAQPMMTVMIFHEVKNGENWAEAWRKGRGSRHELFAKHGIKARTFKDPKDPDSTGVVLDVPDMAKLQAFLASDEAKKAMSADGVKVETMRMLVEFVP